METLVVVADHRNYTGGKSHGSARFGSSPLRGFREISCRAFESGGGLLPSPLKFSSAPLSNGAFSSPRTPTHSPTPTACENTPYHLNSGDGRLSKRNVKSSPMTINVKAGRNERPQNQNTSFSELWAGPAYSNSPPPSSVPMPKFSMKPRRTVSLELPPTASEITPYSIAKSAPASPTRSLKHSGSLVLHNDDNATKTLRRILNLDVADD
ncbi:hypothetical protein V2J09_004977 [Rumex salicifolius]